MIRNERFKELCDSLADGFLADNAVLVLFKIKSGTAFSDGDGQILKECSEFFENKKDFHRHVACELIIAGTNLPRIILQDLIDFFVKL